MAQVHTPECLLPPPILTLSKAGLVEAVDGLEVVAQDWLEIMANTGIQLEHGVDRYK